MTLFTFISSKRRLCVCAFVYVLASQRLRFFAQRVTQLKVVRNVQPDYLRSKTQARLKSGPLVQFLQALKHVLLIRLHYSLNWKLKFRDFCFPDGM